MRIGQMANVDVSPANLGVGVYGDIATSTYDPVPPAQGGPERARGSGLLMGFTAAIILWQDVNGDGWVGIRCDPEVPEEWDAENGMCRADPYREFGSQPQAYTSVSETLGVCGASSLKTGTITLTPVGGEWPPGTTVMRWYDRPTRDLWHRESYVATGTDPIVLRWDEQCGTAARSNRAIDQVFFPRGNTGVGILTVTEASIEGFRNPDAGIEIERQRVRDVDFYHPSL